MFLDEHASRQRVGGVVFKDGDRRLQHDRPAVEIRAQLNGIAIIGFENGEEILVARRHVPELRRRLRR